MEKGEEGKKSDILNLSALASIPSLDLKLLC
jgi:hypothetical protein